MKKMRVSFDIDIELFARMCAAGGEMHIDVFGDTSPTSAPALPPPRSMMAAVIVELVHAPHFNRDDMKSALAKHGYSQDSVTTCFRMLLDNKYIRTIEHGKHTVTKAGVTYASKTH
jgi:hypothetical protein